MAESSSLDNTQPKLLQRLTAAAKKAFAAGSDDPSRAQGLAEYNELIEK